MFKNKPVRIVILVTLASILSYSIAQACSLPAPQIIVRCSNFEASIATNNQSPMAGETYDDVQKRWTSNTFKNLQAVIPNCAEDMTPVLDSFKQEIVKWLDYKNKRAGILDRDLILEPYSIDRDIELQRNEKKLLSCGYEESKHVADWLIVFKTNRSYCSVWSAPWVPCPSVIFSLTHFILYLATNFSLTILPYQIGLVLAGVSIMYIWWRLLKNRPVLKWWKITTLSIVVFALELFLIINPVWVLVQIIELIFIFYILVLWYKQIKFASKQKAG